VEIDVAKNIILFYDGDCGLCNSSVQFVLKHRKHNAIYFATLQSDLAKQTLNKKGIEIKLDTLYFLKNEKFTNFQAVKSKKNNKIAKLQYLCLSNLIRLVN
jgi:predicted DCC family thiol-disulfide oxidoreductase YuxK